MSNRALFLSFMKVMLCFLQSEAAYISFTGINDTVMEIVPEKSTGIDRIYILHDLNGVQASYDAGDLVEWSMFDNLGASYATPLKNILSEGSKSILEQVEGDRGYIIKTTTGKYTFWVIDYSTYKFNISSLYQSPNSNCESTIIGLQCNATPIYFYTINGRRETLGRDIGVSYYNLYWNDTESRFVQENITREYSSLGNSLQLIPPLYCDSRFNISGDRFLKFWGKEVLYESDVIKAESVDLHTAAVVDGEIPDNMINSEDNILGGSAPCVIRFESYTTDKTAHIEWQISTDDEFTNPLYRFTESDLEFNFTEEGKYYVRCIASNSDGSCESIGDIYEVMIGESELKIPNIFTPNDDGINDIWKVSYRSLLDFKCYIFDRYGRQIYYFDNPSQGWDGKDNNGEIHSGVFYYIINATGADGKRYKKSGDINILIQKR